MHLVFFFILTLLTVPLCRYNAITGEWAQDQVYIKMAAQVSRLSRKRLFLPNKKEEELPFLFSRLIFPPAWFLTAVWERSHEGMLQDVRSNISVHSLVFIQRLLPSSSSSRGLYGLSLNKAEGMALFLILKSIRNAGPHSSHCSLRLWRIAAQ